MIHRHFLPWDRLFLPQAVEFLAGQWTGAGPLDLGSLLVIVPTRQAGRRLREALATHAAQRGQAVFPPRVVLPESLLASTSGDRGVATPLQALLAWTEVLLTLDLAEFRALIPVDPPRRDFAWALRFAAELTRLQGTLAEGGLRLGDVVVRAPMLAERQRWVQLAELARRQEAALLRRGWQEPQAARVHAARNPVMPPGVKRVVVLAVADLLPLAESALTELARRVPVDVLVAAPPEESVHFDGWGRPLADAWMRREPPFADFDSQVHLLADASAQAEQIAAWAAECPRPDGVLGIGLVDPEVAPLAENALRRAGRPAYNPAGERHRGQGMHAFLTTLAGLAREPSFRHALALGRTPEGLLWLASEIGAEFSADTWLRQLDELQAEHLPGSLAEALDRAREPLVVAGLGRLSAVSERLGRGDFSTSVEAVLARVFAARRLDLSRREDRRFSEAAEAWMETVRECDEAAALFPGLGRHDWWELALQRFGEGVGEAEKPAGALELQGWLELPFEEAPHLVLAGFNEGAVPESVVGDVFLPETLRATLGLKTNAGRFARDAYWLHALVASRRVGGRVEVLLGKVSGGGEPRRPSRLLMQCADSELPRRIARLFRPIEAEGVLPAWQRAWKVKPRKAAPPEKLAPTSFRSYLECPFRFYLRHVLGMEAVEAGKRELDAFDFGRLCHKPLELLELPGWKDCTDDGLLATKLVEELDRYAREKWGAAPSVPVLAQLESARQRLRWAAKAQVRERNAGWVVQAIERKFELEIAGLKVVGRIDRIDRHEQTGEWRVVDYKTSDTAKTPAEAHLASPWPAAPEWAMAPCAEGRPRQWTDLQLPLYLEALPRVVPGATSRAACAYFNLPKAATATALAAWEGYSIEMHESALRCAAGVVAAVRAGSFWPPNEEIRAESDEFAALFHRGVAASIQWEGSA